MNRDLLNQINNYLLFFGIDGVVDRGRVYSIQKNEQNTPYFELNIEGECNILYSINLSRNRVFVQNIPIYGDKSYSVLFALLKIDLEGVKCLIKE